MIQEAAPERDERARDEAAGRSGAVVGSEGYGRFDLQCELVENECEELGRQREANSVG